MDGAEPVPACVHQSQWHTFPVGSKGLPRSRSKGTCVPSYMAFRELPRGVCPVGRRNPTIHRVTPSKDTVTRRHASAWSLPARGTGWVPTMHSLPAELQRTADLPSTLALQPTPASHRRHRNNTRFMPGIAGRLSVSWRSSEQAVRAATTSCGKLRVGQTLGLQPVHVRRAYQPYGARHGGTSLVSANSFWSSDRTRWITQFIGRVPAGRSSGRRLYDSITLR